MGLLFLVFLFASFLIPAARQTAENRNSMWQDLTRGRETEIGALAGKFVEIAEKAGFDVPGHRAVLLGVRAMEKAEKRDG